MATIDIYGLGRHSGRWTEDGLLVSYGLWERRGRRGRGGDGDDDSHRQLLVLLLCE
jgi:hypothetical protein